MGSFNPKDANRAALSFKSLLVSAIQVTNTKKAAVLSALLVASSGAFSQATFTNSLGMTFVKIPAGSFMMGSCDAPAVDAATAERSKQMEFLGQAAPTSTGQTCPAARVRGFKEEKPRHRVDLKPFWMGTTEVTLGQFKKFIVEANRTDIVTSSFIDWHKRASKTDQHPVIWVTWNQAQDFIKWLNTKEGGGYRLPSEAEWEYACRAGTDHEYCGRDTFESGGHRAVGTVEPPNNFGLYGMSGNVREWVQDTFQSSYKGAPTDGSAWEAPNRNNERTIRGAGNRTYQMRATGRESYPADQADPFIGIRVVKNP